MLLAWTIWQGKREFIIGTFSLWFILQTELKSHKNAQYLLAYALSDYIGY